MPYKMETYQQILTILSHTKTDEFTRFTLFTELPPVEIAHRLPSRSRAYVNQCLDELVRNNFCFGNIQMNLQGPISIEFQSEDSDI